MRKWICASIRRTIKDKSRRREGGKGIEETASYAAHIIVFLSFREHLPQLALALIRPVSLPLSLSVSLPHTSSLASKCQLPIWLPTSSSPAPPTPFPPPTPTTTLSVYAQFCIYFQQINAAHLGHEKSVLINHLMLLPLLMPLMPLGAV